MALVGVRYIQDEDPGTPPSTGYDWFRPSTDEVYVRNQQNTEWIQAGYATQARLGAVPLSGGAMVGAVQGSSDLTPVDSPDMTGTPRIGGKQIATVEDVKRITDTIRREFAVIVRGSVNGAIGGVSTKGSIKFTMGTSGLTFVDTSGIPAVPSSIQTHYDTIPLPPDMTEADCVWVPTASRWSFLDYGDADSYTSDLQLRLAKDFDTTKGNRDYIAYSIGGKSGASNLYLSGYFHYLIIGVK